MEFFIGCVVSAHQSNVFNCPGGEVQVLPGATEIRLIVHYAIPIVSVHGHFNVVRIGAIVPVPKEQLYVIYYANCAQLNYYRLLARVFNGVPCEPPFRIIVSRVPVQETGPQVPFNGL